MNANDNLDIEPLPDLFPWLEHHHQQTQDEQTHDDSLTTLDEILSTPLLKPSNYTQSPTSFHHRTASQPIKTGLSPTRSLRRVVPENNVSFSSLINNDKFKNSLKTVLSRHQSTPSHSSAQTLSRKLPDRSCDNPTKSTYPNRNLHIPRPQSQKHIRQHQQKHTTTSQGRTPKSTPSLRKVRSSSCSKLPRRKSHEIPVKRPCDLADKAIAEGTPLSKEQARAIRNRQHAMASRLRAKQKRQSLESDNKQLKNRIKMLEEENLRLVRVRDALRFQQQS